MPPPGNQGRLTRQSFEDSDTVTYLYDNDGALSTVIDSASGSKTKYFYDFAGRLAKFTEDRGSLARRVEYTYTEENQVSQKSEFAGSVRQNTYYRYDALHRRTQVGTSSTWWKYTYDTLGRVATQRFTVSGADILTETFTYNNANQVTSIQKVTPENTRTHSYTYDANGNIETVTVGNKTIRYTYDTAGQLIREDNTSTYLTTVWTYDNAGNILSEKVYPYTIGEPYELLEANSYTYGNSNWGDLLTAYNGQPITYDQIGNPLTYNNGTAWTFTWEHGRQLATMTSGGTTWTNTYNSDGLRTSRANGTTTYNYYYEGSQLTSVSDGDVDIWIFYDGNRPVIIKYRNDGDEDTYHYELNLQGDVIAILDSNGTRVVEYTYDAWGNILSITGSKKDDLGLANPLRYRGYVYDDETGLYYLQSRYYDPKTHRFLNADAFASTGQGFVGNNMFAYCNNDPVNSSDPTGHSPLSSQFAYAYCQGYGGKTYIVNQNHPSIAEKSLGITTISHGGCGVIATYNALISLGKYTRFDEVLSYYNRHASQLNVCGLAGIPIDLVAQYFRDNGYRVCITDNQDEIDIYSKYADACIMWYMFPASYHPWIDAYGAHFVEYSKLSHGYIGRNIGDSGTTWFKWPSDCGDEDNQYYCVGIFIYK